MRNPTRSHAIPSARLTRSGESLGGLSALRGSDSARLVREVRGELDWIVMKAPGKDRTRRYEGAKPLDEEVVQTQASKLGADHPDTLTTKNNLALLYLARERYDLAEPLLREVVEGSRRKLGPAHPDTLQRERNLPSAGARGRSAPRKPCPGLFRSLASGCLVLP
jgi:hypothetical protein